MRHRCPYKLKSALTQDGLRHPDDVDVFKTAMLNAQWDWELSGRTFVYWRRGDTIYIAEGHHRVNAALEIGQETDDWSYLERLLRHTTPEEGELPSRVGHFPTRSIWSKVTLFIQRWLT